MNAMKTCHQGFFQHLQSISSTILTMLQLHGVSQPLALSLRPLKQVASIFLLVVVRLRPMRQRSGVGNEYCSYASSSQTCIPSNLQQHASNKAESLMKCKCYKVRIADIICIAACMPICRSDFKVHCYIQSCNWQKIDACIVHECLGVLMRQLETCMMKKQWLPRHFQLTDDNAYKLRLSQV